VAAGVPKAAGLAIVNHFLRGVIEEVLREQRLELRGFGVFSTRRWASRTARRWGPGARTRITVLRMPARWRIHFRPGKELDARLQAWVAERCAAEHISEYEFGAKRKTAVERVKENSTGERKFHG
jgi:nucleoid DNA-binding protein